MIYQLTNPSGRLVSADDKALIQIVLRGDWPAFTLHTKVDPQLFLQEAATQTIKTNLARLTEAAESCTRVTPLPGTPVAEPTEPKGKAPKGE
jgi:hypothetical protein